MNSNGILTDVQLIENARFTLKVFRAKIMHSKILGENTMKMLKQALIESIQQMHHYFKDSKDEIADKNTLLLLSVSLFGLPIVVLLLIVTPFIVPSWFITIGHWLFLPFFLITLLFSFYEKQKTHRSYGIIHTMVLTFMIVIMGLIIYINTVPYPESSATLVTAAMIVLPVLLIVPFHENILVLIFSFLVFLFMNKQYIVPEMQGSNIFNGLAGLIFGIMVSWIVTNLRAQDNKDKREIVARSTQDNLTGILNKSTVEKKCFTYLEESSAENCTLIVIDIDNFKNINDSQGHYAGDQVLSMFGEAVQHTFRETDLVGRIGGDEFLVLMKGLSDSALVTKKMERLNDRFRKLLANKINVNATCSYGAILKGSEYIPYISLFKMSDKILYLAKKTGKNHGTIMSVADYHKQIGNTEIMFIVDDSEINRSIIRSLFEDNFDILEAENGEEAIELIEKHQNIISIMLLDMMLPEMGGFLILDWLETQHCINHFPVIAISSDEDTKLHCLQLGVTDIVSKPFVPEILKKRVANATRK